MKAYGDNKIKVHKTFQRNNKRFTLVELIVVLLILAILLALLIPSLTGYITNAGRAEPMM